MQTETHPESLRETVKLLFYRGLKTRVIAEETGVKPGTIKTWIHRYGWNRTVAQVNEIREGRVVTGARAGGLSMSARSARLRSELADEIEAQLAALRAKPVKPKDIGNSGEGRASIVKRLVDAAALVHDWNSERISGIIAIHEMVHTAPEELAVANSAR